MDYNKNCNDPSNRRGLGPTGVHMKPSIKGLLLALVLWGSLLPAAWAAGGNTTEQGAAAQEPAEGAGGHLETSQPLAESGISRQKDLKAELLARYGTREKAREEFRDPRNDVQFSLPEGFALQGLYGRGKHQEDILMRASRGDTMLVYMANGAMMKTDGEKEAKPFQSEKIMLELTLRTYEEEAKAKDIPVQAAEMGEFAGREGLHIRQLENGKVSDRYFFGDRKNLYSLSFLVPEKEAGTLEPAVRQVLDSLEIGGAYERITLPHSGVSYEIPFGSVDIQKAADPGDPHQLSRLHLDNQLVTGVIFQSLQENMDYAFLPDSLEDLCDQDRENLCRLMTENRRAKWEKSHPGLSLKENRTYFSKAAGRTCIVEEEVTPGGKSLGYVFLRKGTLLSLDYFQLGARDQQKVIDHSVNSLQWKDPEPPARAGKKGPAPAPKPKYGGE